MFGCLIVDKMAFRNKLNNDSSKKFIGAIDCDFRVPAPLELLVAKDALVYLLNSVDKKWNIYLCRILSG